MYSENAYAFAKIAEEIDQAVTRMIFESYGVDQKYYDSYIKSITYLLRVLKNKAPEKGNDSQLGFVAHTDKSFTTVLHQDRINALEIETKNGDWIKVDLSASPSSFVVFAGDALMVSSYYL